MYCRHFSLPFVLLALLVAFQATTALADKAITGFTVNRARKVERFLSQPFFVAKVFTGLEGEYVPVKETVESFEAIIDGNLDEVPEQAFLNVGSVEQVLAKAKKLQES